MKLVRFSHGGRPRWGRVESDGTVSPVPSPFAPARTPNPSKPSGSAGPWDRLKILPPCDPTKIVAVGLNYRDHAAEMDLPIPEQPCLFLKAPGSLAAHGQAILLPRCSARVDYEAELAFVVGRRARNVCEADAPAHILGYTCANDVTARDLQKIDGQWARAKSFDTFCPCGPWIDTGADVRETGIRLRVDGEIRQSSNTRQMIFSPARILSFVSGVMTLFPGDLVITGTPGGIGPMRAGDSVTVEIDTVGSLTNPARLDP